MKEEIKSIIKKNLPEFAAKELKDYIDESEKTKKEFEEIKNKKEQLEKEVYELNKEKEKFKETKDKENRLKLKEEALKEKELKKESEFLKKDIECEKSKSEIYKNLFETIFKNTIFRENILKNTSKLNPNYNDNYTQTVNCVDSENREVVKE